MKKIYYTVEESTNYNGYELYDSYEETLRLYKKILHDEANYNYFANKNHIYNLERIEIDDNETEDFYTLKSISVKDYKDLDLEKKEEFFYE